MLRLTNRYRGVCEPHWTLVPQPSSASVLLYRSSPGKTDSQIRDAAHDDACLSVIPDTTWAERVRWWLRQAGVGRQATELAGIEVG